MTEDDRCARCGRPINVVSAMWTPTTEGELCSYCVTGHGPTWVGDPGTEGAPSIPRASVVFLACCLVLTAIVGVALVLLDWSLGWWVIGGAALVTPMTFLMHRADVWQYRAEEKAR
jgi:hypothetical protein